jgi:hypothetical protein
LQTDFASGIGEPAPWINTHAATFAAMIRKVTNGVRMLTLSSR